MGKLLAFDKGLVHVKISLLQMSNKHLIIDRHEKKSPSLRMSNKSEHCLSLEKNLTLDF